MKRFSKIYTMIVVMMALAISIYVVGYSVGKVHGYDQRRGLEIEVGKMLLDRGKMKNPFKQRY